MVWMLDVCKWLVSLNFFVFGIICYLKEYDTVLDADEEHDHACVLVLSEVDAVGANALCALFWGQIKQFSHDRSLVDQSQVTFKVKSRKDIIEETFLILILNFGVAKWVNFVFFVPLSCKNIEWSHANALEPFIDIILILLQLIIVPINI